eukprot:COSAG03_NODE_5_length_26473_cov_42.749526_4_plen_238_part_00
MFLWSRDCGLPSPMRHCCFFSEKICESRRKNGKTLMRGREDEMDKQTGPRRFHSGIMNAVGGAAVRRIQADQPQGRAATTRQARPATTARGQHTRNLNVKSQRATDARNLEFARAVVRLLRGADGNPVQRTAPLTAPAPLTTARTDWHCSSSSRPGREEEWWRSCESCGRPASADKLEAPGNGRAGGPGELAGPGSEVVGLMGCKEGNRPLLPYPRASLTASRPRRHWPAAADFPRA